MTLYNFHVVVANPVTVEIVHLPPMVARKRITGKWLWPSK